MTQAVKGKSRAEVERLFEQFHELVTGKLKPDASRKRARWARWRRSVGCRRFPMRVKCASMPWHTLQAALRGDAADGP